jgi:hypothetical protein
MMSHRIQELLSSVPTLKLTLCDIDTGKPMILAGDDAIFRVRTNELGRAYAALVVEALPYLELCLRDAGATVDAAGYVSSVASSNDLVIPKASIHCGAENEVRGRIEAVLGMHSELKSKLKIMSKLVFAAVAPFLSAGEREPELSKASTAAPSLIDILKHRSSAVSEFIGWLAASGTFPITDEACLDEMYMKWEETQHEDS